MNYTAQTELWESADESDSYLQSKRLNLSRGQDGASNSTLSKAKISNSHNTSITHDFALPGVGPRPTMTDMLNPITETDNPQYSNFESHQNLSYQEND